MRNRVAIGLVLAAGLTAGDLGGRGEAAKPAQPMIGHMVYFQLKDNSPEMVAKLVKACDKYLTGHEGEAFYAAGTLAKEFDRPVNDREWDVALHIVFKDKAAHDKYQDAPRHTQFIDENKDNWKKVRVFDSAVEARPSASR